MRNQLEPLIKRSNKAGPGSMPKDCSAVRYTAGMVERA